MEPRSASTRMYHRRRDSGQCRRCRNKAEMGRHLCTECYTERRASETAKNHARKASGLCPQCGQPKPLGRGYCDRCASKKARAASTHKASYEDRERLFREQAGLCPICQNDLEGLISRNVCVDHDHATGKIRGLLCGSCNKGIGHFDDDPSLLMRAADYLATKQ